MSRRTKKNRRISSLEAWKVRYLHPSLRPLAIGRRRRWKIRRNEALRIRKRTLYYTPLPRVFPWYCDVCALASVSLNKLLEHNCPPKEKRKGVEYVLEYEANIVKIGNKSQAKDCMAVLERCTQPQYLKISTVRFPIVDETIKLKCAPARVPSLSTLCTAKLILPTIAQQDQQTATKEVFQPVPKDQQHQYVTSGDHSEGFYCIVCKQLYTQYSDYDKHLEDNGCGEVLPPDPITVDMRCTGNIPRDYSYGMRKPIDVLHSQIRHKCTRCHRTEFSSTANFHQHIFECASAIYVQSVI